MTETGPFEFIGIVDRPPTVVFQTCSTCKHWEKAHDAIGYCQVNGVPHRGSENTFTRVLTLDMSLCSMWETKETAEQNNSSV